MAGITGGQSPPSEGDSNESAYLADLLDWLKTCPCKVPVVKGTKAPNQKVPLTNLFEVLTIRRPDLLKISASYSDSTTMVLCAAIINELLESFISSQYGTNISDATFPLSVFPHCPSSNAIGTYLKAMGTSYEIVVSTFRSEARTVAAIQDYIAAFEYKNMDNPIFSKPTLLSGTTILWERVVAIGILGLQALDVAAITRETIYPREYLDLALDSGPNKPGQNERESLEESEIPTIRSNWGYATMEAMVDTDEGRTTGLCFVKSQFLPRSTLSLPELLELTKTTWFQDRLVITNDSEAPGLASQLSHFRIQELRKGRDTGSPITGPLTAQLCHDLQAFIRLKIRLGWTVDQLDAALDAIRENHIALDSTKTLRKDISLQVLGDLSRIIRLSRLVPQPIDSLLPLWTAGIRTHGDTTSIYARTFQTPRLAAMDGGLFAPIRELDSKDGYAYFAQGPLVGNNHMALMAALECDQNELRCLLKAAAIHDENQPVTMALLGKLYRHNLARQILRVTSSEYLDMIGVLPAKFDLFKSPRMTLEFVQVWRQLQNGDWSSADILSSLNSMKNGETGVETPGAAEERLCLPSAVVENLGLGVDELKYIANSPSTYIELNNSAPSVANLSVLESYRTFRSSLNHDRQTALIELLNWIARPTGDLTIPALCSRLSAATGWPEPRILVTLEHRYPRVPVLDIIARFGCVGEFTSLQATGAFSSRIVIKPSPRFSSEELLLALYDIATPLPPSNRGDKSLVRNATVEASLRACFSDGPVLEKCARDIHEARQNALVAFLLQQPHLQEQGVSNVSELFVHFLIEEQMDAQQETTRVKAAISSVQMFVQSCMLGLGPRAVKTRIDQAKWAGMSSYSLWKAKRTAKVGGAGTGSLRDN